MLATEHGDMETAVGELLVAMSWGEEPVEEPRLVVE